MAPRLVNQIAGPILEDAYIFEMAEIHIDSKAAPQAINENWNGSANQKRENISIHFKTRAALHKAALKGDWGTLALHLSEEYPQSKSILRASITKGHQTVLHIATAARQISFVEKLVDLMDPEDLTLADKNGNTAFCFAAAVGMIQIAEIMLTRNSGLMKIRGGQNMTPLYIAAFFAQKEMASFLYCRSDTQTILTAEDRKFTFFTCIRTGLYDLGLKLLKDNPELAVARDENHNTALHVLARMPSTFASRNPGLLKRLINSFPGMKFMIHSKESTSTQPLELVRCLWGEMLNRDESELSSLIGNPSQLLFDAAKLGNFEFLAELIRSYPDLVYELDNNNHSIFHIAVLNRHADIFNLIYETAFTEELMVACEDNDRNNILHLAAKYPQSKQFSNLSGAALEMQRELLWFMEIEKKVRPSYKETKNLKGQTPQEIFSKEHKELLRRGELWMKKTAESCMIVATLIATIMFAAAFIVPGGNDNKSGIRVHLRETLFQVLALSDTIALSSSSISILVFLSILTSRYAESDFLMSLPLKLMVGLSTLFISIITMMLAFSTTILLAYHDKLNWVTMLSAVLPCILVTLFVLLQYPILRDIFCSTYYYRYMFKRCN